jgi:hypothetical protein
MAISLAEWKAGDGVCRPRYHEPRRIRLQALQSKLGQPVTDMPGWPMPPRRPKDARATAPVGHCHGPSEGRRRWSGQVHSRLQQLIQPTRASSQ